MKKTFIWVFAVGISLSVLADILRHGEDGHGTLAAYYFPGFYALFGFVFCSLIITISKWLGHHWLQKKEDYYEGADDE